MGLRVPGPTLLFVGLVSLPFDLLADALLLPVDLGVLAFGETAEDQGAPAAR